MGAQNFLIKFKESCGRLFCGLGYHKWELRHPFTHYGIIYGKIGFICERPLCEKEKTVKVLY